MVFVFLSAIYIITSGSVSVNIKKFEENMAVFSFKQHQDFMTYLSHLETNGWTIEDAKKYIEEKKRKLDEDRRQTIRNQRIYESKMLKCPKCSTVMFLRPVNTDNKTQTGDPKDKSVWMCPNEKCLHTIYNEKAVQEIVGI